MGLNVNKYKNQKIQIDGITFASKHEANRYCELKYMERAGLISDLQLQRVFTLIGTQRDENGKVLERPVKYIADFVYKDQKKKVGCRRCKIPRNTDGRLQDQAQIVAFHLRFKDR